MELYLMGVRMKSKFFLLTAAVWFLSTPARAEPYAALESQLPRDPPCAPETGGSCCDAIVQASAPSRPIERGIAGPGLLAHVLVAKFADHLPLYRQSVI
jgi:transposase